MHPPRPPAFNHGVVSALWGVSLGAFIWIGLLSVEMTDRLTSLVCGIVGGVIVFFANLRFGADAQRPRPRR